MQLQFNEIIKTNLERYSFGYGDKKGVFKLILGDDNEKYHYTFLCNDFEKEIDIHRKFDQKRNGKEYEPILKISYYTCLRFTARFSKVQIQLLKKYWLSRVVSLKKLTQLNVLLLPLNSEKNETAFIAQRRKKKFRIKSKISIEDFNNAFIRTHEIDNVESEVFWVYIEKGERLLRRGTIIRSKKKNDFFFIDNRTYDLYQKEIAHVFVKIIQSLTFDAKNTLLALLESTSKA